MELKGKVIEFAGRDYFVVDQFMYNDKEYLYIIQAKVQEKMDVYFLIKDKEGKYEAINDEEIFEPDIKIVGTGDGIAGAEVTLRLLEKEVIT